MEACSVTTQDHKELLAVIWLNLNFVRKLCFPETSNTPAKCPSGWIPKQAPNTLRSITVWISSTHRRKNPWLWGSTGSMMLFPSKAHFSASWLPMKSNKMLHECAITCDKISSRKGQCHLHATQWRFVLLLHFQPFEDTVHHWILCEVLQLAATHPYENSGAPFYVLISFHLQYVVMILYCMRATSGVLRC